MNKTFLAAALAAAILCAPQAFAQQVPSESTVAIDRIVAVVNDDVITERELQRAVHRALLSLRDRNIELPPMEQMRRQIVEQMIMQKVQLQRAKERNVKVDDSVVNSAIERVASDNRLTIPQLQEYLSRQGESFEEFRNGIREEIQIQRLRQMEVDRRIQVSPGEINTFLKAQQAAVEASGNLQYHLAHILIDVPNNATDSLVQERHAMAARIAQTVAEGKEDFAKLAAGYSHAEDAMRGGDLGWRGVTRMPRPFWDALAGKSKDAVLLVRGPGGFHILKVLDIRDGSSAAPMITQTHARHILVRTNATTSDEVARERLLGFKRRILRKEADFETLARLHSMDGTATRGGDLGWVYPGDFVPEFEAAMDKLPLNQLSDPVKTQFGWHLIEVLGRRQRQDNPQQARVEAVNALRESKMAEATENWLMELRAEAYVDLRLEEREY